MVRADIAVRTIVIGATTHLTVQVMAAVLAVLMARQVADLILPLTRPLGVTLSLQDTNLVLAHISSLAVAVSAALGVGAGQLRLGAHAAAHLSDQGAVGVLTALWVIALLVLAAAAGSFAAVFVNKTEALRCCCCWLRCCCCWLGCCCCCHRICCGDICWLGGYGHTVHSIGPITHRSLGILIFAVKPESLLAHALVIIRGTGGALKQAGALGATLPEFAAVVFMNVIVRGHIVHKVFATVRHKASVPSNTVFIWRRLEAGLLPTLDVTI